MSYTGDLNTVAEVVKTQAIVSDAKPKLGWIDTLKALDVAFTCGRVAG